MLNKDYRTRLLVNSRTNNAGRLTGRAGVCAQQHYTVRSLEVMAECTCNGQNIDCRQSNETGSYECVCGGFTTGRYCEACQPLYNQQPFKYGVPCEGLHQFPPFAARVPGAAKSNPLNLFAVFSAIACNFSVKLYILCDYSIYI